MMSEEKYGFIPKFTGELPELNGKFHQLEHVKSGARLVWLERQRRTRPSASPFRRSPGTTPEYSTF